MYENRIMKHFEIILRWGREMRENDGEIESNSDLL
jgi:hypothetical protein